jgi:hypothetical protein
LEYLVYHRNRPLIRSVNWRNIAISLIDPATFGGFERNRLVTSIVAWSIIAQDKAMEKYAARSVKQQIDRILWEVWDPIGVNKISPARDEYSGYVNGVFQLLTSGVSDEEIAQHLLTIVHDRMELKAATVAEMQPTVTALRAVSLPS